MRKEVTGRGDDCRGGEGRAEPPGRQLRERPRAEVASLLRFEPAACTRRRTRRCRGRGGPASLPGGCARTSTTSTATTPSHTYLSASGNPQRAPAISVRVAKGRRGARASDRPVGHAGRPVRGLPAQVVGGQRRRRRGGEGAGVPGPRFVDRARTLLGLEVSCPGPEAALALVGARRPGGERQGPEVRGTDRVVVRRR